MNYFATKFPRAYLVFNQFKNGSKQLFRDGKTKIMLNPKPGIVYTPHELITHHEFGADLRRCFPVFVLFWIPMVGQWIAIPLAVMFPRQMLSRQFWTDAQRIEALDYVHDSRVALYPKLSECFLKSIDRSNVDAKLSQISCDIIEQVSNGKTFQIDEAKAIHYLFSMAKDLRIDEFSIKHQHCLCRYWGSPNIYLQALYTMRVDTSLLENGIGKQTRHIIDMVCHRRGLRLENKSIEDCKGYLKQWLDLSKDFPAGESSLAYLLHLPLLMRNNATQSEPKISHTTKT